MLGGIVVLGAIGGFFAARAADRAPSAAELDAIADTAVATVTARLSADGQRLTAAAASLDAAPGRSAADVRGDLRGLVPSDRVLAVALTDARGAFTITVAVPDDLGASLVGTDLASRPEWALALDLARDRAAPGIAVGIGPDGRPTVLDALPLYVGGQAPAEIAGRRTALAGFVVTVTPASTMLGLPAAAASEVSVRVVDGDTVVGALGRGAGESPPDGAVSKPIAIGGVAWTVQAWATPDASSAPWVVLVGGILLALVVAGVAASRERSIAAAIAESDARSQELALIARAGPLLQQSLALGDLLPVFVVEIGDELALDGISISLSSDTGELVRVFSLGGSAAEPLTDLASLGTVPTSVAPGQNVVLPLQRAGRVVGALQARAVTGLTPPQMETLKAVGTLLAAAIGNARLFQDEQHMVTRLRDVDRLKTTFIGSVSHELRTSVTAILGFAGLLEAPPAELDAKTRTDYIERIARNARSLAVLIEDLLDFARFERSGLTAALRPIDLSALVPPVVEQMSSVLGGRSVTIDVEPNVVAMADTLAVERILANLLSNAGKYTPPDTAVEVGLVRNGTDAVLCVTDHGPGVASEERDRIFELFYRSDQLARVTRGVGIGLALTRQLVDHLNGTISVEESPGGGALFRVTIPLTDERLTYSASSGSEPTNRLPGG